jgi:hypothetical protein
MWECYTGQREKEGKDMVMAETDKQPRLDISKYRVITNDVSDSCQ